MSLRVLCLGDSHFQVSNTVEVDVYLSKLRTFLETHTDQIDIIVAMGDILHTHSRLHVVPLNKATEYFKLLTSFKPTYAIVGNHDSNCNSIFLTPDHWMNFLKYWPNMTVVDTVQIQNIKDCKIVLCPYVPDGRFIEALDTKKGQWEDANLILSHITIKGANMGNSFAEHADEWKSEYPFLISGHIHLSQQLAPNMYYTGSILQVAVDESPNKHIVIATVSSESKSVQIKEIDLQLPRREIIYVNLEDINDFKVPFTPNVKYTLYIQGDKEDFRAFLRSSTYKDLISLSQIDGGTRGIKFKPRKTDIKEAQSKLQSLKNEKFKHFNILLEESIKAEKDSMLFSLWKHLIDDNNDEEYDPFNENIIIVPKRSDKAELK